MDVSLPRLADNDNARATLSRADVLYTDLDGTLLGSGGSVLADAEGTPSIAVAEAIVALNRAGLRVVPVSGRGRVQLTEFTRLLGWRDFIAEAGAIIVRAVESALDGHRAWNAEVTYNLGEWPEELVPAHSTPYAVIEASGAYELLSEAFPGRIEYHAPWHTEREATHILRGCIDVEEAGRLLSALEIPVDILDNGVIRSRGALSCGDETVHAYHLVPKGVSKAQAIALDLASRGLEPEQAAAIGDSLTDLEMSEAVGLMALVGNALESPSLAAALERETPTNLVMTCCPRSDGWAEFARDWLAARGVG